MRISFNVENIILRGRKDQESVAHSSSEQALIASHTI